MGLLSEELASIKKEEFISAVADDERADTVGARTNANEYIDGTEKVLETLSNDKDIVISAKPGDNMYDIASAAARAIQPGKDLEEFEKQSQSEFEKALAAGTIDIPDERDNNVLTDEEYAEIFGAPVTEEEFLAYQKSLEDDEAFMESLIANSPEAQGGK